MLLFQPSAAAQMYGAGDERGKYDQYHAYLDKLHQDRNAGRNPMDLAGKKIINILVPFKIYRYPSAKQDIPFMIWNMLFVLRLVARSTMISMSSLWALLRLLSRSTFRLSSQVHSTALKQCR